MILPTIKPYALLLSMLFFAAPLLAADEDPLAGGLGDIANNLMAPVMMMSNFLSGMAVIIGVICLFSAFVRYTQYRRNPLAQPISMVIILVILGALLLMLPLIYKLTESGVPFSLG